MSLRSHRRAPRKSLHRRTALRIEQFEERIVFAAPVAQNDGGFSIHEDAVLTVVASVVAQPLVYNAGADMAANEKPDHANDGANPNFTTPQWSYGQRSAILGPALTLYTAANHQNNVNMGSSSTFDGFSDLNQQCCGRLPSMVVNTGAPTTVTDATVNTGEIVLHPDGSTAGGFVNEEKPVVRFTASVAGIYSINAIWEDIDDCCTDGAGVDIHVVRNSGSNSSSLYDGAISREADALPTSANFVGTTMLQVGDSLDFVVGTNGKLYGDSTRFNAIVQLIPIGLFANNGSGPDTDADGNTLTVSSFSPVSTAGAIVNVTADGGFTYDPRSAAQLQALATGESINDTFTYTITDGQGGFSTATVTVIVTGNSDANDDRYTVNEDNPSNGVDLTANDTTGTTPDTTASSGTFNGLLVNDDPAGTLEIYAIQSALSGGSQLVSGNIGTIGDGSQTILTSQGGRVVVADNGTFTYDQQGVFDSLASGQTATDSFTYTYVGGVVRSYNAASDLIANEALSGTEANPNPVNGGVWSYGKRNSLSGTAFTPLNIHFDAATGNTNLQGWYGGESAFGGSSSPLVAANISGTTLFDPNFGAPAGPIPANSLVLHPANGDAANPYNIVRWTAPTTGVYNLSAHWSDISSGGVNFSQGVDVHVLVNGVSIFDSVVSMETGNPSTNTLQRLTFSAGTIVDFVLGPNGNTGQAYYNDGTVFNANIDLISSEATVTFDIVGQNDAPTLSAPAAALVTVNEGQTATNSGTFSDVDFGDNVTFTASVGTVTKSGTNNGTWNWSFDTVDNLGPTTVTITATDDNIPAGTTQVTFSLVVNNVAPVATPAPQFYVNGNSTPLPALNSELEIPPGTPLSFTVTAQDQGPVDTQMQFDIDWGNGNIEQQTVTEGTTVTFNYDYLGEQPPSSFPVTLTVQDKDGGVTTIAQFTVKLANVAQLGDTLYVGGTSNPDRIIIQPATGGKLSVRFNNALSKSFSISEKVVVFGNDGNDTITVSGNIGVPVEFYGGAGNDYLAGAAYDDILDGGDGNDRLLAGTGNDFLYGGLGNDTLAGGLGNDTVFGDSYLDINRVTVITPPVDQHGRDTISGEGGNDFLYGEGANDTINGGLGNDFLRGGDGNDSLSGYDGHDLLSGDAGNDKLYGRAGLDVLIGGDGLDTIYGGTGDDLLFGNFLDDDNDNALALIYADWIGLGPGDQSDAAASITNANRSPETFNDLLYGEAGSDWYLLYFGDKVASSSEKAPLNTIDTISP